MGGAAGIEDERRHLVAHHQLGQTGAVDIVAVALRLRILEQQVAVAALALRLEAQGIGGWQTGLELVAVGIEAVAVEVEHMEGLVPGLGVGQHLAEAGEGGRAQYGQTHLFPRRLVEPAHQLARHRAEGDILALARAADDQQDAQLLRRLGDAWLDPGLAMAAHELGGAQGEGDVAVGVP